MYNPLSLLTGLPTKFLVNEVLVFQANEIYIYEGTYCQTMFINGNLFNEIPAFDPDFLLCNKVLNYNVCHVLSESITLLVQAMHC